MKNFENLSNLDDSERNGNRASVSQSEDGEEGANDSNREGRIIIQEGDEEVKGDEGGDKNAGPQFYGYRIPYIKALQQNGKLVDQPDDEEEIKLINELNQRQQEEAL